MEEDQQFCLRWNNHQSTLISVFDTLLENGTLVDCTLAAEGKFLKAHKVVLSACSPYFATLLSEQYDKHPIFILKDVKYQELRAMMDYMYRGEVNISQDQLAALLKAAESLQIKGLSDNRGGAGSGGSKAGEPQKHSTTGHHVPGKMTNIGHMGAGYTLEQAKRARIGPSSIDSQDIGGSREGSSSPTSRRRKKIRRRSVDNVMGDNHENSNSSQNMQINSSVTGPGAITTSIVPSGAVAQAASGNQIQTQTNKKTDNLSKLDQGVSVSTINQTASATATVSDEHDEDGNNKKDQHHHHQHIPSSVKKDKEVVGGSGSATSSSDIVIEPKSEYDDGNEETVEDLTLDDEMALDELDQTAGPSHGGEGSSQGYAQWQVDRSHDESYMAQDVQQRDPQAKQDKGEQTDLNEADFELDDCLLESNNIVITQNKDGYVLHVQKLGNVTEEAVVAAAQAASADHTQSISVQELKPHLTTLQTSHAIKLPSSECELINIKKAPHPQPLQQTASSTPITTATIIHQPTIQHQQTQHIVANQQTINTLLGIGRNVQIETKNLRPHIKYSRGNIITTQAGTTTTVMTTTDLKDDGKHEKYEITEIDLNAQNSASIISDLVKYAEIDDIELPDGTKIGFGINPQEITTHHIDTSTQSSSVEHVQQSDLQVHEHHDHDELHHQEHLHHQQQQSEQVSGVVVSDVSVHEAHQTPTITKSYTILQSRPIKHEQSNTTTYELSLSDSSLTQGDESNEQKLYICRHCGKKYRWKSTLRRHENVECGGKEPCHPCPYCSYKAKQRGNLGVHVRKHHPEKPQLESKRGKK